MNESIIYKKLYKKFSPNYLKVENESHLHKNHPQSPKGGNSHFFVEIRSDFFKKLNMVQSHREIFNVLSDEMKNGLHALRIKIRN
ncbi:MAG: BolA family protein [Alphaproteobacteria bacterium]|tara:strand:+ start:844 stop:1098 length:255 start_codon:yes stop_codon:yes gene_type:complete